jgi:hypothetical protein
MKGTTKLCVAQLQIVLHETPENRILELKLLDQEGKSAWLLYDVNESANPAHPQRAYHLRESLVISVRRLLGEAISQGVIRCDGLGESEPKASTPTSPTESGSGLDIPFSIP